MAIFGKPAGAKHHPAGIREGCYRAEDQCRAGRSEDAVRLIEGEAGGGTETGGSTGHCGLSADRQ